MSDSCDPMNCSLLGSSVHGILQARILEWVAISFSKENWSELLFLPPGDRPDPGIKLCLLQLLHLQAVSLPLAPPGPGDCVLTYRLIASCHQVSTTPA